MNKLIINQIPVEIEKKKIKNMYLRVLPPDGRLYITAPLKMPEKAITLFVQSKSDWIKKQQDKLRSNPEEEHEIMHPNFITGEAVLLWGKTYQIEVMYRKPRNRIVIIGDKLCLELHKSMEESTVKQRSEIINKWYREALSIEIPELFIRWEKIIGVHASEWTIRDMKSRWGSCNVRSRKICLNLQLAKKPLEGLEYVVVHELVHLLEKSHNHVFKAYMDQFLPGWRAIKARLNGRI